MTSRLEPRVRCVLPVKITGTDAQGKRFERLTCTLDISDRGARITGFLDEVRPGMALQVIYKNRRGTFRVAWVGQTGTRLENQIGVLAEGKETQFWPELRRFKADARVDVIAEREREAQEQVQRTRPTAAAAKPAPNSGGKPTERLRAVTEELLDISKLIERGEVDAMALQEFRQALGYVRNTSWMLQQWFELQQNGSERLPLLTMLNTERLRLASSLCNDLADFLATAKVQLDLGLSEHFIAVVRPLVVVLTTNMDRKTEHASPGS